MEKRPVQKSRYSQIFLIVSGSILTLAGVFYDFLRGSGPISIGTLQMAALVVGFLLFLSGIFFKTAWMQKNRNRVSIYFHTQPRLVDRGVHRMWIIDLGILMVFLLIALAFFFGRWKGANPVIDLGSDAATVATYAAVLDHPQNFANDFFFKETGNFTYYINLHIPYLRLAAKLLGGYGLAYLSLIIPILFLQLAGFYTFGKKFFHSRIWALLLAILSLFLVFTESSDYWGIYKDPQPRMLFGAFFPWLLTLTFAAIKKPNLRIWTMVLTGLLFYVHPVSTPGVAFAVWLAFLAEKPKGKRTGRHMTEMFALGMLFAVMTIPFAFIYFNSRDLIPTTVDYSTAMSAFKARGLAMFDIGSTFLGYLKLVVTTLLLPLAVLGWFLGWLKFSRKFEVKVLLIWIAGLLFVAVGLTYLESLIDSSVKILPVLLQMNRDMRYTIPLLEISALLCLTGIYENIPITNRINILKRSAVVFSGVLLVAALALGFKNVTQNVLDMKGYAQQTVKCWFQGELICPDQTPSDLRTLLAFISENTGTDDTFLSVPPINANKLIRYQSLRSVVFDINDVQRLLTSNTSEYFSLLPAIEQWQQIETMADDGTRFQAFLDFASSVEADFAVVSAYDAEEFLSAPYTLIYSSGDYAIVEIPK